MACILSNKLPILIIYTTHDKGSDRLDLLIYGLISLIPVYQIRQFISCGYDMEKYKNVNRNFDL